MPSSEAQTVSLVTTREMLVDRIAHAEEGEVIELGDVVFPGYQHHPDVVEINKSVILRSGKPNGERAVLTNGSFVFSSRAQTATCSFENIDFVGEAFNLNDNLADMLDGNPAIELNGNVDLTVKNCSFSNYLAPNGAVICADYKNENEEFLLTARFENCKMSNNASKKGGACYFTSDGNNLRVLMSDCEINDNYAQEGGGVYLDDGIYTFNFTKFDKNQAYAFLSTTTYGGAIYATEVEELNFYGSTLTGNSAQLGGGAYFDKTTVTVKNSLFSKNEAKDGGALYLVPAEINPIKLFNSEFRKNLATGTGGSIFFKATIGNSGKVYSSLCSYVDNESLDRTSDNGIEYILENFSQYMFGNAICESELQGHHECGVECEEECPYWYVDVPFEEEQLPSEENGYNYLVTPALLYDGDSSVDDIVLPLFDLAVLPTGYGKLYGDFIVGCNVTDEVEYRVYDGNDRVGTVTLPYGRTGDFSFVNKEGYTLERFGLENDLAFNENEPLIVGKKTRDVTVHAYFVANKYTVTFEIDGAKSEVEQEFGAPVVLPPPKQINGYDFVGYYTAPDGRGEMITAQTIYAQTQNATYYAFYKKQFPVFVVLSIVVMSLLAVGVVILIVLAVKRKSVVVNGADLVAGVESKPTVDISALTPREKEVLELLLQGKQRNEIATTLYVSENTVKKNISGIYAKLKVTSRTELFALFK